MPGINGIEAVKLVKKDFPGINVLMQTAFENDENVFEEKRYFFAIRRSTRVEYFLQLGILFAIHFDFCKLRGMFMPGRSL